jgi:ketosteroid isomerase-like protein
MDVVLSFVDTINRHDVPGLYNLMADEHVFVDSIGDTLKGREEMRKAWIAYFYLFPDYAISYTDVFVKGDAVALFGTARGTYSASGEVSKVNSWEIPASWKGIVKNDLIVEWRVYADNEPVRRILDAQKQ